MQKPVLVLLVCLAAGWAKANLISEGDSLFALRATGFQPKTGLVDSAMIDGAITAYKSALDQADSLKDRIIWKLMHCYYYKGNFTTNKKQLKKRIFQEGIELGNKSLIKYPDSPGIHFWMGILWGYWSEQVGLLTAGRKGIAGKIRYHAETLIRIDDTFADGGAYRTLGRVHFKAPKIPIVLNWPSKDEAIFYLEKAYAINPDNLFTKQYYAEAIYSIEPEKAIKMMQEIIRIDHTVHGIAEDAFIKKEARQFLKKIGFTP
jgi:tetratricopeptide (TPR) repeat protein